MIVSIVMSYGGSRRDIFEKTLLNLNTEYIIVPFRFSTYE